MGTSGNLSAPMPFAVYKEEQTVPGGTHAVGRAGSRVYGGGSRDRSGGTCRTAEQGCAAGQTGRCAQRGVLF